MDSKLFNAILSMDAYNRGYDAAIQLNEYDENGDVIYAPTQIGEAQIITTVNDLGETIFSDSSVLQDSDKNIGFYGLAYDIKDNTGAVTETIISYRGTDNPGLFPTFFLETPESDFWNGWVGALGVGTPQAQMAFELYNSVKNAGANNITTTGHSLGGGLAGLVAGAHGSEGVLFDNMPFEFALHNINYFSKLQGDSLPDRSVMRDLVYGENTLVADIPDTNLTNVKAISIQGEVLSSGRFLQSGTKELFLLLDGGANGDTTDDNVFVNNTFLGVVEDAVVISNIPAINDVMRHSMSSLVIRLYATTELEEDSNWAEAAPYFWPVLYDDGFAASISVDSVDGKNRTGGRDGVLRDIIAYSAIEHSVGASGDIISQTIFGDTGIRALYDDANDLGAPLAFAEVFSSLLFNAKNISKVMVGFAGRLAVIKYCKPKSKKPLAAF